MEGGFRVLETAPLEAGQTALQPTQLVQATRHGRVIYPLFSKEIQRIGRAHKARTRSEYLALKAELKEAKIKYKSTRQPSDKAVVDGLYKQLDALQEKRLQSKKEYRELRRTVRAECRILRKRPVGDWEKNLIVSTENDDTWKTRLPHMQKLFLSYDQRRRESDAKLVESVISNGDLSHHQALETIRDWIDSVMAEATVQPHVVNIAMLDAVVYALSRQAVFLQFMEKILGSEEFLNQVVTESYHHDLFDKTVLLSGAKSGWKLRMHVFLPASFSSAQEEVHSHRNHFVSHILHGAFRQEVWEEPHHCVPTEEKEFEIVPFHKYIYDPIKTEDGTRVFNISPLGKIDLARVDQVSVGKGGAYYMHPSVLHSVNAIDGCTVTLVLNSPQATTKSCFASLTPWKEESFVRERFTLDQVKSTLAMVAGLLNN